MRILDLIALFVFDVCARRKLSILLPLILSIEINKVTLIQSHTARDPAPVGLSFAFLCVCFEFLVPLQREIEQGLLSLGHEGELKSHFYQIILSFVLLCMVLLITVCATVKKFVLVFLPVHYRDILHCFLVLGVAQNIVRMNALQLVATSLRTF